MARIFKVLTDRVDYMDDELRGGVKDGAVKLIATNASLHALCAIAISAYATMTCS